MTLYLTNYRYDKKYWIRQKRCWFDLTAEYFRELAFFLPSSVSAVLVLLRLVLMPLENPLSNYATIQVLSISPIV